MSSTPFEKENYREPFTETQGGGYGYRTGNDKLPPSSYKNPELSGGINLDSSEVWGLQPDGWFAVTQGKDKPDSQYSMIMSQVKRSPTPKPEYESIDLDESKLYEETFTRFNGSQYGYRATYGMNPRGATWFDVSNTIEENRLTENGTIMEETTNEISRSSVGGYQKPIMRTNLTAEQRILAKSNDTIQPGTRGDTILNASGKQSGGVRIKF